MMGRLKGGQAQLFYQFELDDAVPEDHLVRKIDAALDLSWVRGDATRKRAAEFGAAGLRFSPSPRVPITLRT